MSTVNQGTRQGQDVYIAPTAVVLGDVELGDQVSIWYGAVLRGDVGSIRVGARSNLQDLCCVHMTEGISHSLIGCDVTVGHAAIIHGATVGNGALIGMGALLLDNAEVGEGALVAAGSLVTAGMKIPPRTLAVGRPARVVRELRPEEVQRGLASALHYVELAQRHRALHFGPVRPE